MYYKINCLRKSNGATISEAPNLPRPINLWNKGKRFSIPVPTPLKYAIEEDDEGIMLPMFDSGNHLLMTTSLIDALKESGVDNLDVYDAEIIVLRTGETFHNYKSVNIIGVIKAADKSSLSEAVNVGLVDNGLMTMWFKTLKVDESTIHGILMFRLAEHIIDIIVHESVKKHLQSKGFDRLSFTEV